VKSYQTLSGAEIFIRLISEAIQSFQPIQALIEKIVPFASFQYLGYATHCLSRNCGYRGILQSNSEK